MFEPQREAYEYHINLLSVKMKVKFPCRMKIEHQGSLLTGEAPLSSDNRYIFNQQVILKDQSQRECFELTINLLTDKGAKYIAGIIKLYHSELIRSQGERLVLSLSKCIDSEAFCEIKVDQVVNLHGNNNAPYDRKSTLQREVPFRQKDAHEMDLSPHRNNYYPKIQQSKSEYQFPLHQNKPNRQEWDSKSKSRFQPPQTVYQRSKVAPRVNYMKAESPAYQGFQTGQSTVLGREKALQAEVYKQGYQKLKQKYKKQTQICKQQLNKRLALQNSENNLKLQIMRLKLRVEEHQKSSNDKNSKIKEYQAQISILQQKQIDNAYLREELAKKEQIIRSLEQKNRSLSRSLDELRDLTADRNAEEGNKVKQLQFEMENMRLRMESKEREFEKQNRGKIELLHQKELQLVSKSDSLERERKTVGDLQKTLQNKSFELQKLLQNERNGSKVKLDDYKTRIERLQRDQSKLEDDKKQLQRQLQILRSTVVKSEYDKKIMSQEFDSLKSEFGELKPYKEKYNELVREHRSVIEERTHLERQLERTIQNKQVNLSEINKQFTDQMDYYKRINRELDEKVKSLSNKLIQVEGQYELSRNQQDKLRRNLETAVKESSDAREKEKTAKKALKNKEQETLSMQSQQATLKQKLKNIDQIYKLQLDKARDQGDKYRSQFEEQLSKSEQLLENNNQLNMELSRIKIKLQYAEERAEKDAVNLKDKQNQVESLIKDYEQQISSLEQVIVTLRQSEKDQSNKLQKYEVDFIKSEEKIERNKKDIKVFEQRCINYENTLKVKQNELQTILKEKQANDKKATETDAQLNHIKSDMLGVVNQRNKLTKMNELLQEQIKKAKSDINNYATQINQKEKSQQELRTQIKNQKDENAKLDLKFTTYRKQSDRHKQTLFETIQKYLSTIPLHNNPQDSRKSLDLFIVKKPSESSFSQAFSLITNYSKEIKQFVSKQSEQIKQIHRENERLHEQVSASANKCQNSELTLKNQLEQLEFQLHQTFQEKEEENANLTAVIGELNQKISQLQMVQQELNTQIEELNFTNNSLKMDYQAFNDQNSKKISNLKKLNAELEEKIEYQAITIVELDERCSAMEADIDNLQATIENDNEVSLKKDKIIEEIREAKDRQEQLIEDLKKQKKDLSQKVSQLQLHLNTEREIKEKTKQLLEEQESKASELKVFISNLMKQKETAIKNQLERSESIITLETTLLQTNKELELLKEQNQRNFRALQAQKEQNKKLNASMKDIDNERREQKLKHTKNQQKLREKEKELINKEDLIKKMQQKYEKMTEKYKLQLKQIQQELDLRSNTSLQQTKDSNEKIIQLQSQIQKKTSIINGLQMKLGELQQQFYAQRQKYNNSDEYTNRLRSENEQLKVKINQMDIHLNDLADDSKDKEEKLFEFSGKIYTLQLKLQAKEHQTSEKLQMLNSEWVNKYEAMCEQYEQRLELVQKERDYFKTLHQQKDKQISKLNNLLKVAESNESNTRRTYEEKVKKLEEEKLSLFSIKNSEIQRLIEQIKSLSENLKSREAELRRISNELEVARKTITNLDQKSKQYDEKVKSISKVYQTELEQLKKKDVANKAFREAISNHQWNAQREIKKLVQGFIKNFLEISEDKNSQRLLELVRSLQKTIMQVLAAKPVEK